MTKQIANDQKQHRESIKTHINKINDNLVNHNLNDTTNNQLNNNKFNYSSRSKYNNQHRNFNNNNKDKSSFSKHTGWRLMFATIFKIQIKLPFQ